MAHPYDTEANLKLLMGAGLVDDLLDLDGDGSPDNGVYAAVREEADVEIDARLAQKFTTPFDTVPDLITVLSNYFTGALLLAKRHPGDPGVAFYAERAKMLLDGLLDGTYDIDAAKVDADEARVGFKYKNTDPVFGGVDASSGKGRMEGW